MKPINFFKQSTLPGFQLVGCYSIALLSFHTKEENAGPISWLRESPCENNMAEFPKKQLKVVDVCFIVGFV